MSIARIRKGDTVIVLSGNDAGRTGTVSSVNRKEGTSKMSGSIFGEAFWGVLGLRFRKLHPAK